jgi:hypothetical protein
MTALPVPSLTAVSRRSGSAAAAAAARAAKNLPPSHTLEHDPWYRTGVLERSLSRNDAELAAVIELNRTLLLLRNQIQDLDPLLLLYLGNGTYQLNPAQDDIELGTSPNNSSHETAAAAAPPPLPGPLRDASVQFLLRLKLRRRLLNRLARRLNRVAFAMDGGSVGFVSTTASSPWQQGPTMGDAAPPALPRYGDLPIPYYLDQENMKEAIDTWKQIWTQWDNIPQDLVPTSSAAEPPAATSALEAPNAAAEEPLNEPEPDEHGSQPDPKITSVLRSAQDMPPIDYDDAYEKTTRPGSIATAFALVQDYQPNKTMEDYQRLKPGELGIGASAFPSGVGGTGMAHPNSAAILGTVEGKQEEFKRWQQALLAKIPAQPTFAELGLDHRVFCEQARLQQALEAKARTSAQNDEEDANDAPDTETTESGGLKRSRKDDSDDMQDDDASTESDKPPKKKKMKSKEEPADDEPHSASPVMEEKTPVEKAEPKDEINGRGESDDQQESPAEKKAVADNDDESLGSADNDDHKSDGVQDEAVNDDEVKPKRISLKPVPSFYLQDLKRIKLAHTELMISSLKEEARRRLNDSTRDYNVGKLH